MHRIITSVAVAAGTLAVLLGSTAVAPGASAVPSDLARIKVCSEGGSVRIAADGNSTRKENIPAGKCRSLRKSGRDVVPGFYDFSLTKISKSTACIAPQTPRISVAVIRRGDTRSVQKNSGYGDLVTFSARTDPGETLRIKVAFRCRA